MKNNIFRDILVGIVILVTQITALIVGVWISLQILEALHIPLLVVCP